MLVPLVHLQFFLKIDPKLERLRELKFIFAFRRFSCKRSVLLILLNFNFKTQTFAKNSDKMASLHKDSSKTMEDIRKDLICQICEVRPRPGGTILRNQRKKRKSEIISKFGISCNFKLISQNSKSDHVDYIRFRIVDLLFCEIISRP